MSFPLADPTDQAAYPSATLPPVAGTLAFVYGGEAELNEALCAQRLPLSASNLQGCLPFLLHELSARELEGRLGREPYERLRGGYRDLSLLNLWYSAEMQQVLEAITAANIQVMVLKGADVAATVYPCPDLRYFGDVDLLLHPGDLQAVITLLESREYSYLQEYRFEAISRQRAGFVYIKRVAAGYLMIELHIAPHSNELGVSFNVADLWARARSITAFETRVSGMGLEDLLLYLCWHYRTHTFERLIWLYDVAFVLQRYGEQLDWALLYRLARSTGLRATVYYVVSWCRDLLKLSLPEEAQLEHFAPPPLVQQLVRRAIGEDLVYILRRPAKRERKLLQHLAVDDLKTLLAVELRAIFPSPTHLGRLYMEHSRLPLRLFWVYYFVHPLIALRETLRSLSHRS